MSEQPAKTYIRTYLNSTHYPPYVQQYDMRRLGREAVLERLQKGGGRKEYSAYAWHTLMREEDAAKKALDELLVVVSCIIHRTYRRLWDVIAAKEVQAVPGRRGHLENQGCEVERLRHLACARLWEVLPVICKQAGVPCDEITARALIRELRLRAREEWLLRAVRNHKQG